VKEKGNKDRKKTIKREEEKIEWNENRTREKKCRK
jgi:hypothetical protein